MPNLATLQYPNLLCSQRHYCINNAIIKGLIGLVKGIPCVDKVYDLKTDIAKACQEDLSIYLKGTEPHHFYMMRCSILLNKV
jgi:hypothetical protein